MFGGGTKRKEYKGYFICKSVSHGYGYLSSGRGTMKTKITWYVEDGFGIYYHQCKNEAACKKHINDIHRSKG